MILIGEKIYGCRHNDQLLFLKILILYPKEIGKVKQEQKETLQLLVDLPFQQIEKVLLQSFCRLEKGEMQQKMNRGQEHNGKCGTQIDGNKENHHQRMQVCGAGNQGDAVLLKDNGCHRRCKRVLHAPAEKVLAMLFVDPEAVLPHVSVIIGGERLGQ